MYRYGPTQGEMNLAAYPRVEKNTQEMTQSISFYKKTNRRTEAKPMCENNAIYYLMKKRLKEQD